MDDDPLKAAFRPQIDHTQYEIEPVLAHEKILKRNQLHKLPQDFYRMIKELMTDMDSRNSANTEAHMNTLLRLRLGKIIELAAAGAGDTHRDLMTSEEQLLFDNIVESVREMKRSILHGDDT